MFSIYYSIFKCLEGFIPSICIGNNLLAFIFLASSLVGLVTLYIALLFFNFSNKKNFTFLSSLLFILSISIFYICGSLELSSDSLTLGSDLFRVVGLMKFFFIISFFFFLVFVLVAKEGIGPVFTVDQLVMVYASFIGLFLVVFSDNLLLTYLGLEFFGLMLLITCSANLTSKASKEAGIKYFIFTAIASSLILLGFVLIILSTGECSITGLYNLCLVSDTSYIANYTFFQLGLFLIFLGLCSKMGVPPFHMWLPDVYKGSTSIGVVVFVLIGKLAAFFLFFHFSGLFSAHFENFSLICLTVGLLSVAIGSIGGLLRANWKSIVAYSGIVSIGFILLPFSYSLEVAAAFSIYYLFMYMIALSFFLVLFGTNYSVYAANTIPLKLLGGGSSFNLLTLLQVLSLFSLIGLPPTLGFYPKLLIFSSLILNGYLFSSFILIFFSCIAVVFYLGLIRRLLFSPHFFFFYRPSLNLKIVFVILTLLGFVLYSSICVGNVYDFLVFILIESFK